jgi:nitrogen fixation-related uncharacterized protein
MIVLALLAFVSAVLVALAVGLFAWTVRDGTFDHGDHLSLLPLRGDAPDSSVAPNDAPLASGDEGTTRVSRGEALGTEDGFGGDQR